MPSAFESHVSMPEVSQKQPRENGEADRGDARGKNTTEKTSAARRKTVTDRQSFAYVWRSGVAGGLAGCVAKTVVAPLDRVKILFQSSNPQFAKYSGSFAGAAAAMKEIYRQDGARALFRGHSATVLRVFPYAGIKFLAYEQFRSLIISNNHQETAPRRVVAGALAGVTSVFFTYPLEVIRVRLAFETKRNTRSTLSSICRKIYHEQPVLKPTAPILPNAPSAIREVASAATATAQAIAPRSGVINFYRGFTPTLLGMVPYAGVSFLTHDTCGDLLRHPSVARWTTLPQSRNAPPGKPVPLRSWAQLLAGGVAGMVSQTSAYPLEVIRRRMQVGGAVGDGRRLRIAETAAMIMKERGFKGFFVGLTLGYVKVVPLVAVSFYTYERLKTYFGI